MLLTLYGKGVNNENEKAIEKREQEKKDEKCGADDDDANRGPAAAKGAESDESNGDDQSGSRGRSGVRDENETDVDEKQPGLDQELEDVELTDKKTLATSAADGVRNAFDVVNGKDVGYKF